MSEASRQEPLTTINWQGREIVILGTAHVSRASADMVRDLLEEQSFDAVAVELCPSRYNALINPDALARMDLFQVIREGKASMVAANLALGAYQQRMAEQFNIEPGAEMRMAVNQARDKGLEIMLVDREIGVTLKRIYRNVPWWKRVYLLAGLTASLVTREKISEQEIEDLKGGDLLESAFTQFAEESRDLFVPLIDERDRYMVARILQELAGSDARRVLVVIGAGHMKGMSGYFQDTQQQQDPAGVISELDVIPPGVRWVKAIPWLIVILIVIGFVIGFSRSPELGWDMVTEWVLINGALAALGALIAGAHPLTVVGAFVAAPLTSLNPTVGAGMATAAVEIYLRRPQVDDFSRLRSDTTSLKGWWNNRISRTLLIFIFSTLGSAIGTWVAGFRIFDKLVS